MALKTAKRMAGVKASDVREILKITERPGVISFAGGLPAPELFPVKEIESATRAVLETAGTRALQYITTEGFAPLRERIAERMNRRAGTAFGSEDILVTHGSQQALDLAGKVFLDENDVVVCENPTYLAAINAFRAYGCKFAVVPSDGNGMLPDALEETLRSTPNAKFIYVIPTFQNPTGITWSVERRKRLAEISARFNIAVIEDSPYEELRFEGENLPAVKTFDAAGTVLYCGTFSKIFCPGFRIGWIAGGREPMSRLVRAKQCADLQCNTLAQMTIAEFLERCDLDAHVRKITALYKIRRDVAVRAMEKYFPECVRFTRPEGGLFAWAELPEGVSARDILTESLKNGIAFVPGGAFYPNAPRENTLRLNYSNMPEEKIEYGLKILGGILEKAISENSGNAVEV